MVITAPCWIGNCIGDDITGEELKMLEIITSWNGPEACISERRSGIYDYPQQLVSWAVEAADHWPHETRVSLASIQRATQDHAEVPHEVQLSI